MLKVSLFSDFSISLSLLMVMSALLLINLLLSAYRWYLIARAMLGPISFVSILISTYTGLAYNNFLPGNVSGDVIRAHYLYRAMPHKPGLAIASVLYDRVMGLLGLLMLFSCQGILYYHALISRPLLWLFLSPIGGVALIMLLPKKTLTVLLTSTVSILSHLSGFKWLKKMTFITSLEFSRRLFLKALCLSMLIQLVIAEVLNCTFSFFKINTVEFTQTLFASSITQLISLIPVAPGGLGLSEASFGHVMMSITQSKVIAFSTIYFTYRFFNMIMTSPGLILVFISSHKSGCHATTCHIS